MRIIINEFVKTITNKTLILVWSVFVLLNIVILYTNENNGADKSGCSIEAYNRIYDEVADMNTEEATEYLMGFQDVDMAIGDTDYLKQMIEYNVVLDEVRQCAEYSEYLESIQDSAKKYSAIAIFKNKDSFGKKNIIKTAKAFEGLEENELEIGPSRGVNMISDNIFVDIIGIMMLFFTGSIIFLKEKENKSLYLLKSYAGGRIKLITAKLVSMLLCSICITVLVYLPAYLMAYGLYGFGDTGRLIQSVAGFDTTELEITVAEFLIYFIPAKIAVFILFAMIISLIMNIFDSSIPVYLTLVGIIAVETVLYYVIKDSSKFMVFRNLNIYAFMNTGKFFSNYKNLRIFANPVSYRMLAAVLGIVIVIISAAISIIVFVLKKGIKSKSRILTVFESFVQRINIWNRIKSTNIWFNELYKTFIHNKVLLILIAAALFIIWDYAPATGVYENESDVYYVMAINEVIGEYTPEKETYINNRISELSSGMAEVDDDISEKYIDGYNRLAADFEYIKTLDDGYIIYDKGYNILTGKDMGTEAKLAMETVIIIIVSVFSIWTIEYSSGMNVIQNVSLVGKKKICRIKMIISIGIAIIIFFAVHTSWYYSIISSYGSEFLDIPANNLRHLCYVAGSISIRTYLIFRTLIKLVFVVGITFGIRFIAEKLKSHILTVAASTGAFVLPFIILMILGEK